MAFVSVSVLPRRVVVIVGTAWGLRGVKLDEVVKYGR